MTTTLSVKAPGRICFFGDHQDYLGLPVIAATIDRYIYMNATPQDANALEIALLDLGKTTTILLDESLTNLAPRDYFRSAMRVLAKAGIRVTKGYRVEIHGDIPVEAGLSSSSAVVVAWIRLLLKMGAPNQFFSDEQIAAWSYQAEVIEFNEPGGLMDQYTIALGGLVYINTVNGKYQRLKAPWESVIIGDSGLEKSTLTVLSNAKDYALEALAIVREHEPSFALEKATVKEYDSTVGFLPKHLQAYWYAAIHNHLITKKALALLDSPEVDMNVFSELMNAHQRILQHQIGNTPDAMVNMMAAAHDLGAIATKIVGSGGGGCFVALAPKKHENQLVKGLVKTNLKQAFTVQITSFQNV